MATIRSFHRASGDGPGKRHPTTVDCGYRVMAVDGSTVLQLDTYGSKSREHPGKVSQSLQIDRDAARSLKALLEEAFPDI